MRRIELPEESTDPAYRDPIVLSDDPTRIAGSPQADPHVRVLLDRISDQLEEARPLATRSAVAAERSAEAAVGILDLLRLLALVGGLSIAAAGFGSGALVLLWFLLQR